MIKNLHDHLFESATLVERGRNFCEAFKDDIKEKDIKIDVPIEDYFLLLRAKYYYRAYSEFVDMLLSDTSLNIFEVANVFNAIKSYDAVIDEDTKQVIIPINLISDDEELYNKVKQNIAKSDTKDKTKEEV